MNVLANLINAGFRYAIKGEKNIYLYRCHPETSSNGLGERNEAYYTEKRCTCAGSYGNNACMQTMPKGSLGLSFIHSRSGTPVPLISLDSKTLTDDVRLALLAYYEQGYVALIKTRIRVELIHSNGTAIRAPRQLRSLAHQLYEKVAIKPLLEEIKTNKIYYATRDVDNTLCFHTYRPSREGNKWISDGDNTIYNKRVEVPVDLFSDIKWENEPVSIYMEGSLNWYSKV